VSIGSIQPHPWSNPWSAASHSSTNTSWNTAAAGAGPSGTPVAPANPFEQLASNIQAMLIQAQSTTAASGTSTTGGAAAVSPEQNLATSLQTLMNDLQPSTAPNAQTASTNPTDPVGQTEHHHHHHREADGDASGATAVASTTANSVTGEDQAVSQVFAADIAQAIQSYGGASASSMMPALTV